MAGAPFVYKKPPDSRAQQPTDPPPMPDAPSNFRYKRVLLKVSGEVLMGDQTLSLIHI